MENYFLYRHRLNIMSSKNDIQGIIELKRELDGVLRDKSFVKSSVNSDKDE